MNDHPTPLGGTCGARFEPLRELFAAKLESGEDLGASLVFNIDGLGGGAEERTLAVRDLVANLLVRHCGARVLLGLLHPDRPVFRPCEVMPPPWE